MRAWEESLGKHGLAAAQLLLTRADFANRRRWLNARDATRALLALGAVPVVNENDTVATEEIRYGDNDNLSADVAALIEAERLVLLTDVDGLYRADPRRDPAARRIETVEDIDAAARAAGKAGSAVGTGGMITKVEAARKAIASGVEVVIADGRDAGVLGRLARGETPGTRFRARPAGERMAARKRWIANTLKVEGRLSVDAGAREALRSGTRSLLPSGVTKVEGEFRRGAAVELADPEGRGFARGLAAYDASDARKIAGKRSSQIEPLLGFTLGDELVHKDDLVLL
jgi:glutamate 5-kinase